MELRTYLQALRRHLVVVVLLALIGTGLGVARHLTTDPAHTYAMQFYVSTPLAETGNPQSADQFAQNRANTYIALFKAQELANRVIEESGVSLSPRQVTNRINASGDVGTVLITVRVADADPDVAKRLADAVAATFGPMVEELDNQGRTAPLVKIMLVSPPTPAASGGWGLSRLVMVGLAVGLLLGFSYAGARELTNTRVRTSEDLAELTGLRAVGTIPFDAKADALYTGTPNTSPAAEALRKVRTVVQHARETDGRKVLLVSSAVSDEGKSTVAANLALLLTDLRHRVVLVEADLRSPSLAQRLDVPASPGLGELLKGSAQLDDVLILRAPEGQTHGQWVIPAGNSQANPADLLASDQWEELLRVLRERYDHVIIDSPSILPYTDAVVAGTHVDAALLVVRAERTTRDQVRKAVQALQAVAAPTLGAVLTMTKD